MTDNPMLRAQMICSLLTVTLHDLGGEASRNALRDSIPLVSNKEFDQAVKWLLAAKIITINPRTKHIHLEL